MVVQPAPTMQGQPAGFVSRLIAFVVDLLLISGTATVITVSVGLILRFFGLDPVSNPPTGVTGVLIELPALVLLGVSSIFNLLLANIYLLFFWLLTGQTPGKAFVGLRVVTREGQPLQFRPHAWRRLVGYYLSALSFFAGFLWVLIDDERRGWHDKFAGTKVIYAWEARMGSSIVKAMQERRQLLDTEQEKTN